VYGHCTALKLKVLEIYNSKLDKRAERKNFILNRQLVNLRQACLHGDSPTITAHTDSDGDGGGWGGDPQHQAAEKRRRDYKDVYNQHRVFARFQTPADFELFMDGIISACWPIYPPACVYARHWAAVLIGGGRYGGGCAHRRAKDAGAHCPAARVADARHHDPRCGRRL
jgi:hypothetical protein